jgi:hypothetical protein
MFEIAQRIRLAEVRIAKQMRFIAELQAMGGDARPAEELLASQLESLRELHRLRVLLKAGSSAGHDDAAPAPLPPEQDGPAQQEKEGQAN